MFASYNDLKNTIQKAFKEKNTLLFRVNNVCNFKCKHCIQNQSANNPENEYLQTFLKNEKTDYIKNAFSKFENCIKKYHPLVLAEGGETTLSLKKLFLIGELCRKNNLLFEFDTNGWWYNDDYTKNYIKYKIKPNFIRFSIDEYHSDFAKLQDIINLAHFFDDSNIKIFSGTIWKHECKKEDENLFNSSGLYHEITPLFHTGEPDFSVNSIQDKIRIKTGLIVTCAVFGLTICQNGDIYLACDIDGSGCKVSNMYDKNFDAEAIFNKIKNHKLFYRIKDSDKATGIYDICRKNNFCGLDDIWEKCDDSEENTVKLYYFIKSKYQADYLYYKVIEDIR